MKRKLAVLMVSLCLFFSSQLVCAEEVIDTGMEIVVFEEDVKWDGIQNITLDASNSDDPDLPDPGNEFFIFQNFC